jgi:tRNA dimethylallyltransferase
VRAVLEGFSIPSVPPHPKLREELERKASHGGAGALHAELAKIDPQAAAAIDGRNVRRVIRALEVHAATGIPISQLQGRTPPPYRILKLGLTLPRERLYRLIDQRVERMLAQGLVEEVEALLARGHGPELPALSGLGYAQMGMYLSGQVDLEGAVEMMKRETRRYVRQQYAWFSLDDPSIHWFNVDAEPLEEMEALVRSFPSAHQQT